MSLDREITIRSVYIPPSFSLNSQHLDSLLQQLPSPYIILGDFNGHNILWGNKNNDSRGELIENFITKNDMCIMNDKSYTYLSSSAKSFSSIDLSFCHPSLFLDYPGESLPPCRGLWGTLHTGDGIDCNYCLLWEC